MSDTPRTDAECMSGETRYTDMVHYSFAQQLERELAEAIAQEQIHYDNYVSMKEQRDRLAEASLFLADVAEKNTDDTDLWNAAIGKVRELAAVKGGRMSDKWETFCDECCYHMWCPRKIGQRGFNDGFHINNRDEAIALCDLLNNMERELAEARRSRAEVVEKYQAAVKEMHEAASQRDRLAEALRDLMFDCLRFRIEPSDKTYQDAEEALAFVKGGTP